MLICITYYELKSPIHFILHFEFEIENVEFEMDKFVIVGFEIVEFVIVELEMVEFEIEIELEHDEVFWSDAPTM